MTRNKLLIFDLYGTLVNMKEPLNPFKIFFKQMKLNSDEYILAKELVLTKPFNGFAGLAHTLNKPEPQNTALLDDYVHREIGSTTLFPDTEFALKNMSENFELSLLSNIATPYIEPVYRLGIDLYFKKMFFSCDLGLKKPDKRLFNYVLKELSVDPKNATMIGDSLSSDIEGATSVGMNAFYINRKSKEAIFEKQIYSLTDLTDILNTKQ